jgi:hypothetical protein
MDSRGELAMRRVGLLTFHSTRNYGASLQALGMVQALRRLGFEPEVIDYRPRPASSHYLRETLHPQEGGGLGMRLACVLKALSFASFTRRWLPLSPACVRDPGALSRFYARRYSAVICGSDQIWHVNETFRPFDPSYFLKFVDGDSVRRIAYGPSFGAPFNMKPYRAEMSRCLHAFHSLSVRDEASRSLIRDLCGRDAQRVTDPTLLTDFPFDERGTSAAGNIYDVFYGPSATQAATTPLKWSRHRGGTLLCLGFRGPEGSRSRIAIRPETWLSMMRGARMVFTTTFHGTVFAVKYTRPFVAIVNPWNETKITDFLQHLGLEHRVLPASKLPETLPADRWSSLDIAEAQPRLRQALGVSLEFLQTSMA